MKQFLLVFLGGGLGSMLRYYFSKIINQYFPVYSLGTLIINIIGCLIIGLLMSFSLKTTLLSKNQMLLLATGFCGGFTTFSTFALEGHKLVTNQQWLHFILYNFGSVILGLGAVGLGFIVAKYLS